jgi:hypothetical protein
MLLAALTVIVGATLPPHGTVQAHTGCADWQGKENGFYRIYGRWNRSIGATNDAGRGARVWKRHNYLIVESLPNDHYNFVQRTLWVQTDSGRSDRIGWYVEVAFRERYARDATVVRKDGFMWGRGYTTSTGVERWEGNFNDSVPSPNSYGSTFQMVISWNSAEQAFDLIVTVNGSNYLVKRVYGNRLNAWYARSGSESNHCDGDDGDSYENVVGPTYTDRWYWKDDDSTNVWHQIVSPPTESDLPANIHLEAGGDAACYHMNTTAGC